jgi:hypothetical protein
VDSCNILKFENDWICAIHQGYNKTPSLVTFIPVGNIQLIEMFLSIDLCLIFKIVAQLPEANSESNINWTFTITENDSLTELATVELIKFKPDNPNPEYRKNKNLEQFKQFSILFLANVDFEAVFVEAKQRNNTLVVFPHGKNHSFFC